MQEYDFFQNEELVKASMCDLLYIWARENPDYLYQQGMNDVLAVFMISLAIDFYQTNKQEEGGAIGSIFEELHSPKYFWSEAYFMYEAIMRMGVKGIYFRDEKPKVLIEIKGKTMDEPKLKRKIELKNNHSRC